MTVDETSYTALDIDTLADALRGTLDWDEAEHEARKPYDVVVTAILCAAEHVSGGYLQVASDGSPEEWAEGLALARKVVSDDVEVPPGVRE